jgi:hypothetical protein
MQILLMMAGWLSLMVFLPKCHGLQESLMIMPFALGMTAVIGWATMFFAGGIFIGKVSETLWPTSS